MYSCKILKDSISDQGFRLTTFEVCFPRFILAEVNTHRMLSRNSASSRAIPVAKSIAAVQNNPFVPESFHSNQKGMAAGDALTDQVVAQAIWDDATNDALRRAISLEACGVHKGQANRVLEPYKWHTAILSATDWENFFQLRCAPDAQPEFRTIAEMMREAYLQSEPQDLKPGEWHVPMLTPEEEFQAFMGEWMQWIPVAIGRLARVSYETHDGKRDIDADRGLHNRLKDSVPPHLSPFEHVARPFTADEWSTIDTAQNAVKLLHHDDWFIERWCRQLEYCGNFHGWVQRRAMIPNEHDASLTV